MAATHDDEFKRDAVRIALASGLARRQVASVSGIGHSIPGKRVRMFSDEAKAPAQGAELLRENERLRKENRMLREERGCQERRLSSSRLKIHGISIHCRLSRQPGARPPVPFDGRGGPRVASESVRPSVYD